MSRKRNAGQFERTREEQRWRSSLPAVMATVLAASAGTYVVYSRPHPAPVRGGRVPLKLETRFEPTVPNATSISGVAPAGMVWIPGGEFSMGAQDPPDMDEVGMKATLESRPFHRTDVGGF